jgi:Fe-S cluster assembly protein SufD
VSTTAAPSLDVDLARRLDGPSWLADRRTAALERWAADARPTDAAEVWRYSLIDQLDLTGLRPAWIDGVGDLSVPASAAAAAAAVPERAGMIVTRNGRVVHSELDDAVVAKGVTVGDVLDGAGREHLGRAADGGADWFTELHDGFLAGAAVVHVPRGVVVGKPILVTHWGEGDGVASFPHTLVVADDGAEVTVAEYHASASGSGRHLTDTVVELVLGDNAHVKHVTLQAHGSSTWQIALQRATIGRDASLRSSNVALGGDYARLRAEACLHGQGAVSDLLAVYFGTGNQMLDFRTLQDHDAPRTSSDLLFKGAVDDAARSVYSGLVHLRPTARRAVAHQTNRTLVLAPPPAGAESIPNLQIEADDVQCTHASAIGPVDEDQRYYLATRGIAPADAERLIVFGFFEDVLAQFPVPSLAEPLRAAVTSKFARG